MVWLKGEIEHIRAAWEGLQGHRLRSLLTTLGVLFGVAAVIAMGSISEGARREALRLIEMMGSSNIIIESRKALDSEEAQKMREKNPWGMTLRDAQAIRQILPIASRVVPMRLFDATLYSAARSAQLKIVATLPEYFTLYQTSLNQGRILVPDDEQNSGMVCVLGAKAARELFPLEDPLKKPIRWGKYLFTVVGVLAPRPSQGGEFQGVDLRDENRDVYIPLSTAMNRLPRGNEGEINRIVVQIAPGEQLSYPATLLNRLFSRRHNQAEDYQVIVPEQLLRQHQSTQRIFNVVMGAIASISLLVGGIGIMNIMLASVLERTREIGIRRAVGARRSDIARQFLWEAALLSLMGGLLGLILGIGLAQGISLYAGWETAISWWTIGLALIVSLGVGIGFGYYPARRAAYMDPIEALRYE
ncbi:MAG: ABC transporter permease [bacterium]